ncbi:MAG: hypothetical protein ABR875_01430 [Minisyncoccia bacterium]|jgi:hypothetical protein
MSYDFYKSEDYRQRQSILTKLNWQKGVFDHRIRNEKRICKRRGCHKVFYAKPSNPKVFCSISCAAIYNNTGRIRRRITYCLNCNKKTPRSGYKYCSNACQIGFQYKTYIQKWKEGKKNGLNESIGVVNKYVKRYLREKYKNECCLCGWSQINPRTNTIPLSADHIDGNWRNNREENLRLLCPNCDSLTPTYKNLNKGRGRNIRLLGLKKVSKLV